MRPFSSGWENLNLIERLEIWFKLNGHRLRGSVREYRTFMLNFGSSCERPINVDYLNFLRDIRFYPTKHQELLKDGFFAVYNLTPALLEIRSVEVIDPDMN